MPVPLPNDLIKNNEGKIIISMEKVNDLDFLFDLLSDSPSHKQYVMRTAKLLGVLTKMGGISDEITVLQKEAIQKLNVSAGERLTKLLKQDDYMVKYCEETLYNKTPVERLNFFVKLEAHVNFLVNKKFLPRPSGIKLNNFIQKKISEFQRNTTATLHKNSILERLEKILNIIKAFLGVGIDKMENNESISFFKTPAFTGIKPENVSVIIEKDKMSSLEDRSSNNVSSNNSTAESTDIKAGSVPVVMVNNASSSKENLFLLNNSTIGSKLQSEEGKKELPIWEYISKTKESITRCKIYAKKLDLHDDCKNLEASINNINRFENSFKKNHSDLSNLSVDSKEYIYNFSYRTVKTCEQILARNACFLNKIKCYLENANTLIEVEDTKNKQPSFQM